jgi:hypothetical protein
MLGASNRSPRGGPLLDPNLLLVLLILLVVLALVWLARRRA